jgi:hypothetical protein
MSEDPWSDSDLARAWMADMASGVGSAVHPMRRPARGSSMEEAWDKGTVARDKIESNLEYMLCTLVS